MIGSVHQSWNSTVMLDKSIYFHKYCANVLLKFTTCSVEFMFLATGLMFSPTLVTGTLISVHYWCATHRMYAGTNTTDDHGDEFVSISMYTLRKELWNPLL